VNNWYKCSSYHVVCGHLVLREIETPGGKRILMMSFCSFVQNCTLVLVRKLLLLVLLADKILDVDVDDDVDDDKYDDERL